MGAAEEASTLFLHLLRYSRAIDARRQAIIATCGLLTLLWFLSVSVAYGDPNDYLLSIEPAEAITFYGKTGPVLIIHLDERRIEVPPGVKVDEGARAVLDILAGYLPTPCKTENNHDPVCVSRRCGAPVEGKMSEPKWTPGPWRAVCPLNARYPGVDAANQSLIIYGNNATDYGSFPGIWGADRAEAKANAHLIAAAPELYEALSETLEYVHDILTGPIMRAAGVQWPEGGPNGPVIQRAVAALAKARGEMP